MAIYTSLFTKMVVKKKEKKYIHTKIYNKPELEQRVL